MEYEGKDKPHSETGGVKGFSIEGRFASERERLAGGFTNEDRVWRAQFLKDQILHNEPLHPEWYYRERYNPIRRFYRWPLETLFGVQKQPDNWWRFAYRFWTGKALITVSTIYIGYYIFKYHCNDWTNVSGWQHIASKQIQVKGSPGYGVREDIKPADYFDKRRGFDENVKL